MVIRRNAPRKQHFSTVGRWRRRPVAKKTQ